MPDTPTRPPTRTPPRPSPRSSVVHRPGPPPKWTPAPRTPHPGAPFPPPLLFIVGFGLGVLAERRWPSTLYPSALAPLAAVGRGLAVLLLGAAAVLLVWSLITARHARAAGLPNRLAAGLVARGPYRYTRNPIYLAITGMYAALTLWADAVWPLVLLPVVLALLSGLVIRREERYLALAFGEDYASYCRRVKRWL